MHLLPQAAARPAESRSTCTECLPRPPAHSKHHCIQTWPQVPRHLHQRLPRQAGLRVIWAAPSSGAACVLTRTPPVQRDRPGRGRACVKTVVSSALQTRDSAWLVCDVGTVPLPAFPGLNGKAYRAQPSARCRPHVFTRLFYVRRKRGPRVCRCFPCHLLGSTPETRVLL